MTYTILTVDGTPCQACEAHRDFGFSGCTDHDQRTLNQIDEDSERELFEEQEEKEFDDHLEDMWLDQLESQEYC